MDATHIQAFMREHYAERGMRFCAESLGLSARQVQRMQQKLKLYRKARWTEADVAELRMLWSELPLTSISKRIGRTKAAIYQQAKLLGFELGCPKGWEYLTHAAHRCGFDVSQLRKMLVWAGVGIRRAQSRPGARRRAVTARRTRMWIVEPESVDDAVTRWLATETVYRAAQRHGVSPGVLGRLLEADSRVGPKTTQGKAHWRVPSAVADELIAQWHQRRLEMATRKKTKKPVRGEVWVERTDSYPRTAKVVRVSAEGYVELKRVSGGLMSRHKTTVKLSTLFAKWKRQEAPTAKPTPIPGESHGLGTYQAPPEGPQ